LDKRKPTVYLSLGSEGLEDLISNMKELVRDGVQFVVALGAAEPGQDVRIPEGVFLERYVNTDLLLPHCDLVCCHGGNGTLYQALSFGLPVVVVATHQEQAYGGKRIKSLGLGQAMMLNQVKQNGFGFLARAISDVVNDRTFSENARRFAKKINACTGAQTGAGLIETWLERLEAF